MSENKPQEANARIDPDANLARLKPTRGGFLGFRSVAWATIAAAPLASCTPGGSPEGSAPPNTDKKFPTRPHSFTSTTIA
jgi:hypothetical protein